MAGNEQDEDHNPEAMAALDPPAIETNSVVKFHYRLAEVDSSGNRGDWFEQSHGSEPLSYLHGFHNVVVGLERALEGKTVGAKIEITLAPDEAYGERIPDAVRRIPLKQIRYLRGGDKPRVGMMAAIKTDQGLRNATILKTGKFNCDVDFNHPLAGRTLFYEIEVVSVREATAAELQQGRAEGRSGVRR